MKKIYIYIVALIAISFASCQDMLETDSSRQAFDPDLNQKTDSVFSAFGILQTLQQVADQYFFQNEMRGDLVDVTPNTKVDLRKLYDFTADETNKYDSIHLYYKVINNCNYYLAHRDTALYTGNVNVSINEYIAIASIRAWTYLQLARIYGNDIAYVTEPLMTISQINNSNYPKYDIKTICEKEAEFLSGLRSRYPGATVPDMGVDDRLMGETNWGTNKRFAPSRCFIPVDVVLGDLYLEVGEYQKAAYSYFNYLNTEGDVTSNFCNSYSPRGTRIIYSNVWPEDYNSVQTASLIASSAGWSSIYLMSSMPNDVITYIPMAVNFLGGEVTNVPDAFGYDYYAKEITRYTNGTKINRTPEKEEIQVIPSKEFNTLTDTATYYYVANKLKSTDLKYPRNSANLGDGRGNILNPGLDKDSIYTWVNKPSSGNIILYRTTTVYLHLAEALNRMGYPDAAFAILKDGMQYGLHSVINDGTKDSTYYIKPETYEMLSTTIPFFSDANVGNFTNTSSSNIKSPVDCPIVGIHRHGAGIVEGFDSPYQFEPVLNGKLDYLNKKFNLGLSEYTKEDSINAMEDLLCDEMALEFAFEGCRFGDLQRMARHKNESGLYGGGFGDAWLADKLKAKGKVITTQNCYLPFK